MTPLWIAREAGLGVRFGRVAGRERGGVPVDVAAAVDSRWEPWARPGPRNRYKTLIPGDSGDTIQWH